MKLADIICFEATIMSFQSGERDSVIRELVQSLSDQGKLGKVGVDKITQAVIKRENEASTGIGKGVAIPHVKIAGINASVAAIGSSSEGLDFKSLDKKPVYTVILLVSPEKDPDSHLRAMELIFRNLNRDDFRRFLRQAESMDDVREAVLDADIDSNG